MFAMLGSVANKVEMSESFSGWGGEDKAFYQRIEKDSSLKVARSMEPGLVHQWHTKDCLVGSFVTKRYYGRCVYTRRIVEGTKVAKRLMRGNQSFVDYLLESPGSGDTRTADEGMQWLDDSSRQYLKTTNSSSNHL